MVDFYTKILGYGPHRELPETRMETIDDVVDIDGTVVTASWFATWNFELEFWNYEQPLTPLTTNRLDVGAHRLQQPVFRSDGSRGNARAARDRRGSSLPGQRSRLAAGGCSYARDPDGNLLAFQQNISAGKDRSIYDMRWHDPASYPLPPL